VKGGELAGIRLFTWHRVNFVHLLPMVEELGESSERTEETKGMMSWLSACGPAYFREVGQEVVGLAS